MNAVDGMKICARCRDNKPVTDYHKKTGNSGDGLCLYCKVCKGEIDDENRAKRFARMTPEETRVFKERLRGNQYKLKYGITVAEYEAMYAERKGICDICHKPDEATITGDNTRTRSPKHLMIDHDHTTGKVRGLIHHKCNITLGIFNDDPALLIKAAEYLERRQSQT